MRGFCRFAIAFAALTLASLQAAAEDQKPTKCEPQPTCEFGNLIIKPGAPTPGLKTHDKGPGGIDFQGEKSPDFRGTYRLPDASAGAQSK